MSLRLIRLNSKNDECWGHVPALRRAIEAAGVHFNQRSIAGLIDRVVAGFITEGHPNVPLDQQGLTALWYVLDDAGAVRGHLLALQDIWDGEVCICVNQLYAKRVGDEMHRMALEELDHYAQSRGAKNVFMYTRRHHPKFWKEHFGFEPHRMLYRRVVA